MEEPSIQKMGLFLLRATEKKFRETASVNRRHGSGQPKTFYQGKHGFDRRVGLLAGRAAQYAFSTK